MNAMYRSRISADHLENPAHAHGTNNCIIHSELHRYRLIGCLRSLNAFEDAYFNKNEELSNDCADAPVIFSNTPPTLIQEFHTVNSFFRNRRVTANAKNKIMMMNRSVKLQKQARREYYTHL